MSSNLVIPVSTQSGFQQKVKDQSLAKTSVPEVYQVTAILGRSKGALHAGVVYELLSRISGCSRQCRLGSLRQMAKFLSMHRTSLGYAIDLLVEMNLLVVEVVDGNKETWCTLPPLPLLAGSVILEYEKLLAKMENHSVAGRIFPQTSTQIETPVTGPTTENPAIATVRRRRTKNTLPATIVAEVAPAAAKPPKRASKRVPMTDDQKVLIKSSPRMMNRYLCYGALSLNLSSEELALASQTSTFFRDYEIAGASDNWKVPQFVGYFWSWVCDFRSRQDPPIPLEMPPIAELCGKIERMLDAEKGWGLTKRELFDYINFFVTNFSTIQLMVKPLTLNLGALSLEHKLCREKVHELRQLSSQQIAHLHETLIASNAAFQQRQENALIDSEDCS
jgi:hypothetical protein